MTNVRTVTNFGRSMASRATGAEPADDDGWQQLLDGVGARGLTVRGAGASYSDAALNSGGTVATTHGYHRIRGLDEVSGVVDVDAGVRLAELCALTVPRGWLPPVLPGSGQVTVGGALAADVHGKNHPSAGSFARHVLSARLLTPATGILTVGPHQHSEAFWATAGGLGLTGVVLSARLQLRRVATGRLVTDSHRCTDLSRVLATMAAAVSSHEHVVAWLDGHATGAALGRGVVSTAGPATSGELPAEGAGRPAYRHVRPPVHLPALVNVLRPRLVRGLNAGRFAVARRARERQQTLAAALHPLDNALDWPALYGRPGLIQYQFSVPDGQEHVLAASLERLAAGGCPPVLAVLKRLGAGDPGMLSFPSPGWTMALDLPTGAAAVAAPVLEELDDLVVSAGGRIYLVKDSRLRRDRLPAMYPRLDEWRAVRDTLDPGGVLTSDLDRRLNLSGRWDGGRPC